MKEDSRRSRSLRMVSEIVAVLLVSIIVISVGGVLILKLRDVQGIWNQAVTGLQERANSISNEPSFSVAYSYANLTGGYLVIFLNVAPGSLIVSSIYMENIRLNDNITYIEIDGSRVAVSQNGEFALTGEDLHQIKINIPSFLTSKLLNSSTAIIKIVSKSGLYEIFSAFILK